MLKKHVISRKEARGLDLKRYYTGEPCKNGHCSERLVSNCGCVDCANARNLTPEVKLRKSAWHKKKMSDPAYKQNRAEYGKEYIKNPDVKKRLKFWHLENNKKPEVIKKKKAYSKNRYSDPAKRILILEANKKWKINNPEAVRNIQKKSKLKNRDKINATRAVYQKKKLSSDTQYRLSLMLRLSLNKSIKRNSKKSSATELLGCSVADFKQYIESKFQEGMSWGNWGVNGWHLDHIRPIKSFDLNNAKEQKEAFHYLNFQPLWAKDNIIKGAKYDGIDYRNMEAA